jgi:hypothetical protein
MQQKRRKGFVFIKDDNVFYKGYLIENNENWIFFREHHSFFLKGKGDSFLKKNFFSEEFMENLKKHYQKYSFKKESVFFDKLAKKLSVRKLVLLEATRDFIKPYKICPCCGKVYFKKTDLLKLEYLGKMLEHLETYNCTCSSTIAVEA